MKNSVFTAVAPERVQVLTKALLRATEALGLKQAALARVLGVSPAYVSRMHAGQCGLNENGKEWELATLLVRLYRGLDAIMASDEVALRAWMQHHNSDLNAVPSARITTVAGLVDTLGYVDAYRARV